MEDGDGNFSPTFCTGLQKEVQSFFHLSEDEKKKICPSGSNNVGGACVNKNGRVAHCNCGCNSFVETLVVTPYNVTQFATTNDYNFQAAFGDGLRDAEAIQNIMCEIAGCSLPACFTEDCFLRLNKYVPCTSKGKGIEN